MTFSSKGLTLKRWILFTTYGWFIGILLVVGFALVAELMIKMDDASGGQAVVGMGMGAGVGFMHWMATRKILPASQGLFWYSTIGFSLAFILRDLAVELFKIPVSVELTIPFAVVLGALLTGWLQYHFILKKLPGNAAVWIAYLVAGWLLATLITMGTSLLSLKTGDHFPKVLIVLFALVFLSVGGPVLGYITGRFMVPKINEIPGYNPAEG